MSKKKSHWFVYLLRCSDTSLYTGITTNISQRLHEHNHNDKGAKYTRGRRPVILVYTEKLSSRSEASKREYQIKQMKKSAKEQMVYDYIPTN
ncbi:MAG TPA: GIY-YIG nuclease family protein [Desulfobacterales bacterium]|nr:GIY-YIG nuclease family protein [Desulfobacterales bacterium]